MIKAVLFDLDHTLYDREATLVRMAPALKDSLGVPEDTQTIAKALIAGEEYFYLSDYSFGGARTVYPELCRFITLPGFDAYNDFINRRLGEFVVPYPFVRPLLEGLRARGLRIGMVTNGKRAMQAHKLKTLGLTDLIEQLTCADDAGVLKPDPGIFLHCLTALGASPKTGLYVGDNPVDDIQGASNTGMKSVWIKGSRPYPQNLPRPDYTVESAAETADIVAGLL